VATPRTWTFKPQRGADLGASGQAWCWEAMTGDANSSRSQAAFESLEDCWFDALTHGFEVPHPEKPWEGFSIRTLDDGSLVYSPI
jgi:hypothetical protein